MIQDAFESQELEMPDDYRIKSKEEREREYEEDLKRREEATKNKEEAEAEQKENGAKLADKAVASEDVKADVEMKTVESKA